MGIRRKLLSISSLGVNPYRSNGDKLAKIAKQNQRDERVKAKKDRNLQEQILAEQRRANDLKEQELRLKAATANYGGYIPNVENIHDEGIPWVSEAAAQDFKDAVAKESLDPHSWWDYSNPGKKRRRG
jgi:hypothetical protein